MNCLEYEWTNPVKELLFATKNPKTNTVTVKRVPINEGYM